MWNIKKFVSKGDYVYAVVPEHPKATKNGYVLAHRVLVENSIGRLLKDKEEVHHIDGDRKNNSIENLMIVLHGEHQRMHAKERYPNGRRVIKLICKNCGIEFERFANQAPNMKGYTNSFCSRKCNGKYNGHANVSV